MTCKANNETFVMLLTVARENREEREKLLSILQLEPTRRKIAINILVTNMRLKQAPQDFIDAWDSLQDDWLAERAKQIIEDEGLEPKARRLSLWIILGLSLLGIGLMWALIVYLGW
jgi:hypothetical protein